MTQASDVVPAYIHPRTWDDGVMPLSEFPLDMQEEIAFLVARPTPPSRWLRVGCGEIESRAWYEWHWARGRKWRHNGVGSPRRPSLPKKLRRQVIERDGLVCGICLGGVELNDIHIDHIHPVRLGGGNDLANLQVSHSVCNIRKGAKV